jgi:hypothetical protein
MGDNTTSIEDFISGVNGDQDNGSSSNNTSENDNSNSSSNNSSNITSNSSSNSGNDTVDKKAESELIPIERSNQFIETGSPNDKQMQYIGHVAYSPDLDCLIFQKWIKKQKHILHSTEGKGIGISKSIYKELKNEYGVDYIFIGHRESGKLRAYPIAKFINTWHTAGYEVQKYAQLYQYEFEVENGAYDVFTKSASNHPQSMTLEEYEARY